MMTDTAIVTTFTLPEDVIAALRCSGDEAVRRHTGADFSAARDSLTGDCRSADAVNGTQQQWTNNMGTRLWN